MLAWRQERPLMHGNEPGPGIREWRVDRVKGEKGESRTVFSTLYFLPSTLYWPLANRGNKTSFELFLGPFSGWKQVHGDMATACNS
jgi:hypothetical protein